MQRSTYVLIVLGKNTIMKRSELYIVNDRFFKTIKFPEKKFESGLEFGI